MATLLCVDDSPTERQSLRALLSSLGYTEVIEAESAVEAFRLLDEKPGVHLILMDSNLPGLSGLEACRQIKRQTRWQDIPLIVVTTTDDLEEIQTAFDAGANDCLTRPFRGTELAARVRVALNLKNELDQRKEREKELKEINSVLQDVLELVKEEQIKRADLEQQKLRAAMEVDRHRSIAQMVAGVAHELNTPLGIVNTAAGLIHQRLTLLGAAARSEPEAAAALADMQEASDLIGRNILRAHKLVQDFKKVSVHQITDVKERVKLIETIDDTVGLFKITAKRLKIEITLHNYLPEATQEWVGYPGALSQVILNLLTNIQRYAYPKGSGGRVDINVSALEAADPQFVITVRDFGLGIAPENLPHVFEPFFTTGRSQGGSGLGLAIVYNLVTHLLQGSIGIDSQLEEGTTVRLTLPQTVGD